MKVTICELPHEPAALAAAWAGLCEHTRRHQSELVLLPELAFIEPLWEADHFDYARWNAALTVSGAWLQRLAELRAVHVVGTRPASIGERPFNQGYIWSAAGGLRSLRSKSLLPDEPGGWEARWFDRGDAAFPAFYAGDLAFGLNICTELWALETYAGYADEDVQVILSPRATAAATAAKWLAVGVVSAVRSGAFSISSNRVDPSGDCGGAGWIIAPDGRMLARTTPGTPFATIDVDLAESAAARDSYPCSVFSRQTACPPSTSRWPPQGQRLR
jgi:N-carbamoylputrescine amidase